MKLPTFMKYYSLVLIFASLGAVIASIARKDWPSAMFSVLCCAANHFCYNHYSRHIKTTKREK